MPCRRAIPSHCRLAALLLALPLAASAQPAAPRPLDPWGDPLPDGAVLRLGTIRLRHAGEVRGLAWLADSKSLASAGTDGVVRIWDAATGREVRTFAGHAGDEGAEKVGVKDVFALGSDRLASVGDDRKLRIWNALTGVEERSVAIPFQWASSYCLSRDGSSLALDEWGRLETLNLGSLETTLVCPLPTRLGSNPVCWSADGQDLFAAEGEAALIRLSREGKRVWSSLLDGRCGCVAASPDGNWIAAGEDRRGLRILNAKDGRERLRIVAPDLAAQVLRFSPDSAAVVAGSWNAGLRVYRVEDGACLGAPGTSHDSIWALEFSPDGRLLASAAGSHRVRLWKWPSLEDALPLPANEGNLSSVVVFPDGARIATVSRGALRFWDARSGTVEEHPLERQEGVWHVQFGFGGNTLLTAGRNAVRVWDVDRGVEIASITPPDSSVERMSVAAEAPVVALTCINWEERSQSSLRAWNYRSGAQVCSIPVDAPYLDPIAISPNAGELAHAHCWTVELYALPEGKERLRFSLNPDEMPAMDDVHDAETVQSLAYSNRGDRLAVGTTKGRILLCDPRTGEIRKAIPAHRSWVQALAFSPDDRALASSGWDDTVRVWETLTGSVIFDFSRQRGWGAALAWFPDGLRLVSGGEDCVATVWDVSGDDPEMEKLELGALWTRLADPDASRAWFAARSLRGRTGEDLRALAGLAGAETGLDPGVVSTVKLLDDDDAAVRERADRALSDLGQDAEPALRNSGLEPEGAARVRALLEKLPRADCGPVTARLIRFVGVLERRGTKPAIETLKALRTDSPWSRVRDEAASALGRCEQGGRGR